MGRKKRHFITVGALENEGMPFADVGTGGTPGRRDDGMLTMLLNGVLRWRVGRVSVPACGNRTILQTETTYRFCPVDYRKAEFQIFAPIVCVGLMLATFGCALHHYDEATGTEHIWGFGHMKMKVAACNEGLQAIVHGTDVFGLSLGIGEQQNYLTAGWHRTQRLDVVAESTTIRYEWPDSDFANVRVGSKFPSQPDLEIPDSNEQSKSKL